MSDDLREDKKKKRTATSRISSQVFSLPILDSGFWFCGMWEGREVFLCHTAKSPGGKGMEDRERKRCVISDPVPSLHQFYLGFFVPYNIRGVA